MAPSAPALQQAMSKPWALVTPASRGIGLQLARYLLKNTDVPVVATARKELETTRSHILNGLDVDEERLQVLQLDVTDESTIAATAAKGSSLYPSSSHHLRVAFCIPGILHPEKSPQQIDPENALQTLKINLLGPLLLSKHLTTLLPRKSSAVNPHPNLPPTAILALMAARVGSTSDNSLGGWYSYRASKAGVMSLAKSVDIYLQQRCGEKAICVALHPGTVKTDLSKEFWAGVPKEKLFGAEDAAEKLCGVLEMLAVKGRGRCWDWKGEEILP